MLANCHIHAALDGYDWKAALARHRNAPDEAAIRQMLEGYRRQGYTYLRDGGDRFGACCLAKTLAPEYGITYRSPGAPLFMAGHYGSFIGTPYADAREYSSLVSRLRQAGADHIKIMISGLMDFHRFGVLTEPSLPENTIGELIRIAHDQGLPVMAHANGTQAVVAAARWGVDSVEHGAYLQEEALCAMKENSVIWVPTLSAIGNLLETQRYSRQTVSEILHSAQENVAAFHRLGGLLASGDDAGAWGVPHGSSRETEYLQQAGVDGEALKKGTLALISRF